MDEEPGSACGLFDGRPVIGICNTWSELTPCNAHLRGLAERVKRGVWEAGGLPLEFPVMSLGDSTLRPTAMLFRNLVSMDVEESIRANPVDGVVLMCGCDKTTPALVMGAASCDIPAIVVSGGPMLNGKFHGEDIGSGIDVWRLSEEVQAGTLSQAEFSEAESCMSRSAGHCTTMCTASTMAAMTEALGLALPHNSAIPAVDSRRNVLAHLSGRRIVEMVREDLTLSKIFVREAFENAIRVNAALGGPTNAVIHLLAIAGRIGISLTLEDWDRIGRDVPTVVDLKPSGRFLMEDFYYADGLPAVIKMLAGRGLLHDSALTVTGKSISENCSDAVNWNEEVIRPVSNPLVEHGGVAVLRGNLAPDGAVLKPSAASPHLMKHRGRAVVFSSIEDYHDRIADPALDIDETCIMVLQNCGPRGYPGMAEVGNMGLPPKLLALGIKDMVRISDARMSGTAYGTVVLHICPEAAIDGPLALVRDGDFIELDVEQRQLHLDVSDQELAERRTQWKPLLPIINGGYAQMYVRHVMQASDGADLDFLVGRRGTVVTRNSLNRDALMIQHVHFATYPSLRDRAVIVTGGASGIGEVIVESFAAQRARVAFLDLDQNAGEALVNRLAATGFNTPIFHRCDLTDIDALQATAARVVEDFGGVDVLVNNAGNDSRHSVESVTSEAWDRSIAVNLKHQFFMAQAVIPAMRHAGHGSIINMSSIGWVIPSTSLPVYVTAKAAIIGMTRTLAHELGKDNIRVNSVMPGAIQTERQNRLWFTEEYKAEILAAQALKRMILPEEVARLVLFLAANDSSAITSQSYVIDGGWV